MPVGRVGEIDGDEYVVRACLGPPASVVPGVRRPFKDVLGLSVKEVEAPVAYASLADSPYADHPLHRNEGLKCFIGAPLRVDGERVGVLGFAGFKPRYSSIDRREITLVRLAAIGSVHN